MGLKIILPLAVSAIAFTDDATPVSEAQPTPNTNQQLFDPFFMKNDDHVVIMADVIFWQASQSGLDFAIKNKGSTTTINHGRVENPDFEWNVGYKAAFDYKLPHDKWDILMRYTYLHSTAHKDTTALPGGALFPSWQLPAASSVYATHSDVHWICNLNTADLELGRNCRAGKWLSIRPYMGVKAAIIHQRYHVNYEGGTAVPTGDIDKIKMMNNFWGVGLRFGFNSLWGMGQGLSLYADGAGSLMSGKFQIYQREHLDINNTTLVSITNHPSSVISVAEVALGLQWDRTFYQDRYHFGVKLGWEMQYYWNQNRFMHFLSSSNPGSISTNNSDLSFMGVTLGFRWDF
jgi:hypothetical protein